MDGGHQAIDTATLSEIVDYLSDDKLGGRGPASEGDVMARRYMIEYLGDRSQNPLAAINIGGYGTQQTGDTVSIYRSTARGAGLTGNSFRYVQSYFGKDKP